MKVKEIVNKCRIANTQIVFLENGKEIDRKIMKSITDDYSLMDRTLNTWEIKDNSMIIWIKPLL